MTVGLIHALLQSSSRQFTQVFQLPAEYHDAPSHYLFSQFFGLAGIGRNGHGGFGRFVQGAATINEQRRNVAASVYPGNAPPMRALPLAFIQDDVELIALARANADATHP